MKRKNFWNGGFTLVELMVLMAVVGILMSISIPPAAALAGKYRLRSLDARARTLGLSVQNRLSRLKLYGKDTAALCAAGTGEEGEYFAAFGWGGSGGEPGRGGEGEDFGAVIDILCPAELFDGELMSGFFVLEYRPEDCVVTAVFYSDGAFDYGAASAMAEAPDWPEWREERRIGYYGGR